MPATHLNATATASPAAVISHRLTDDGIYPNNPNLSLLLYQNAVQLTEPDPARVFEDLFHTNHWGGGWRNGIFNFHHYHSSAHEVLGVYRGQAEIQLGGDNGITLTIKAGDVVVIPAGVAHKNLGASHDFAVVGAYPQRQNPDTCYGKAGERPQADRNIACVPLPAADPVYGESGLENWK